MAFDDEDDLFKHTAMTFGEHLEELRSALFKAVLALAIGFGIGLLGGSYIVNWIQTPLYNALKEYYKDEAMQYVNARVPDDLKNNPAIRDLVYNQGLLPEDRYFSPAELVAALRQQYPDKFGTLDIGKSSTPPAATPAGPATPGDVATDGEEKAPTDPKLHEFSRPEMVKLRIWRPLDEDERLKVDTLSVQEPFVIYMKASFLAGAVLSSPAVFYFLWQFVAAGLYPHEKKYIHVFLPFSLALFLSGAALAFFFVFPPVLGFFFGIAKSLGTEMRPRLSEWLSFVLLLPLGFGIAFQLPLVMLFLERIHVFSAKIYLSKWKIAVLLMAIASMVLSPGGDPWSMLMMLGPLVILYFGGIGLCTWLPARGSRTGEVAKPKEYAEVD